MPKQDYSNEYLWKHTNKYKRLTSSDLRNNDSVVTLCEIILQGVREEALDILNKLNRDPTNKDLRSEAKAMNRYLESESMAAMSFGGSVSLAEMFREKCPKGLFKDDKRS